MNKVYLAGPITGSSYEGAVDWRDNFNILLENELDNNYLDPVYSDAIQTFSPMRHKEYLLNETTIADDYPTVLSSQRGITARDRFDTLNADLVVVNLLGAERVSIGTMIEIGWADSKRIPIILIIEESGNLHDHAMVREICPFHVRSIEEAVDVTVKILLP